MPRIQHRAVGDEAADPAEARGVGPQLGGAENLVEIDGLVDHADDGAVLGGLVVEIVGGPDGDGARHVEGDHGRVPGQVVAQMRRDQATIGVVAAAHRIADDEIDGLALVEVVRRRAGDEAEAHQQAELDSAPETIQGMPPISHDGTALVNQSVSSACWPIPTPCSVARR